MSFAPNQQEKRTRVVMLGWYGSDNTGDEAVLEAIVSALRKRGITDLHALSTNPQKTSANLGIPSSPRSFTKIETLRAIRGAKALILGGGGLIQDRTSVYNLPVYALHVLVARLLGLQVVGWGQGVEPLRTPLGKMLTRFICAASIYFSVRDEGAKRMLVKAGVPPNPITVSADPAFILDSEQTSSHDSGDDHPTIIFCLRDLPDNRPGLNIHYLLPISLRWKLKLGVREENERTLTFTQTMGRAVKLCVEEFGARVVFLPLWPGRDDSLITAVMQEAERLGVPQEAMSFVESKPRPSELAAIVSNADLLVSMRLHALIFGACAGVPMLALVYARKMRGLMRMLGAERWTVEVEKRNPPPEEIEMKLRQLWAARTEQSQLIIAAASRARARAEADANIIAGLLTPGLDS